MTSHARDRRRGAAPRRGRSGQAMVEFAITAPLLLFVIFATIDAARAIFYYTMISSDAQQAARIITLPGERYSDCRALSAVVQRGNGMTVMPDPASVRGNADPDPPAPAQFVPTSQPPDNTAYVYLYPSDAPPGGGALAAAPGSCSVNAAATPAPKARSRADYPYVAVLVRYEFVPWTPLVSNLIHHITLQTIATAVPECPTAACT